MPKTHTDREYELELMSLRQRILQMSTLVETLIRSSLQALAERDVALARRTITSDRAINKLEIELDEMCEQLLARRQAVASDLRFVTAVLKVGGDFERIADQGVSICKRVVDLANQPPLPYIAALQTLSDNAFGMLCAASESFATADVSKAEQVLSQQARVHAWHEALFPNLVPMMASDPSAIERATRLQSISKYLERIADHAAHIAEMVVFIVAGSDVRHSDVARSAPRNALSPIPAAY